MSQQDDHMLKQLLQSPPPMNMRLAIGIPLLLMALLLAFEPTVLDFWVADHLYLKEGGLFIGRKSYFLQAILHNTHCPPNNRKPKTAARIKAESTRTLDISKGAITLKPRV